MLLSKVLGASKELSNKARTKKATNKLSKKEPQYFTVDELYDLFETYVEDKCLYVKCVSRLSPIFFKKYSQECISAGSSPAKEIDQITDAWNEIYYYLNKLDDVIDRMWRKNYFIFDNIFWYRHHIRDFLFCINDDPSMLDACADEIWAYMYSHGRNTELAGRHPVRNFYSVIICGAETPGHLQDKLFEELLKEKDISQWAGKRLAPHLPFLGTVKLKCTFV